MSCMISLVNSKEYVYKEKDNFIKYGGVVKRYSSKEKSIATHRTNAPKLYTLMLFDIKFRYKRNVMYTRNSMHAS